MTKVVRVNQVLIHAPLQTVSEYVSDLTKHPEWSGGELKIEEVTAGPIAVGKEYTSRGEVPMQKERPNQLQVTAYEPPHKFGFAARDRDFGKVLHDFIFVEGDGGVLVTRTMTLSLKPWFAVVFQLFIYPFIGKPGMRRSFQKLKTKLEG